MRALDAKCESPSSSDSTRTVVQLGKLPLARRKEYLYHSIMWDLPHLVRCLLQELSADTRLCEDGDTGLTTACFFGSDCALSALLAGGASHALAVTASGLTPLNMAARNDKVSCVQSLIAAGADATLVDGVGNTPLINSVIYRHVECARALLPVSNLLQSSKNDGQNALHASVHTASEECFELLLPLMEDVDVRTVQGVDEKGNPTLYFHQTPLHASCKKGQMAMARALLKRGADRMARDNIQKTPLHWAAVSGALSCVILLVGRPEKPLLSPEQVDAQDMYGSSPLYDAAMRGHEKVCGVLLSVGARLDLKTNDGITPLQIAQHNHPGNTALLELLSGLGPANLPGTMCDHCGKPAGRRMTACGACQNVRYCDSACQVAAWPGHKKECEKEKAKRERRTSVKIIAIA